MIRNVRQGFISLISALLVVGCTTTMKESEQAFEQGQQTAGDLLNQQSSTQDPSILTRQELFLGRRLEPVKKEEPLPETFNQSISIHSPDPLSLAKITGIISTVYGVKVFVEDSAISYLSAESGGSGGGGTTAVAGDSTSTESPAGGGSSSSSSAAGSAESILVEANYEGSLKGFLDFLTAKTNLFWRYDTNAALIFHHVSKSYQLKAFAGTTSLTANIGSPDETATANAATGVAINELSIWNSIRADIDAVKTSDGRISVSEGTGKITVTDSPYVLAKVDRIMKDVNEELSREILLQVEIWEVETNRRSFVGVNWNAVWTNLRNAYSFAADGIDPNVATRLTASIVDPDKEYSGSEMILSALSQQGNLSLVTTHSAFTLSGQPIPLDNITDQTFLARSSMTTDETGNVTFSREPDTISEGISMSFYPRALSNAEVIMQFVVNISTINEIRRVGTEEDFIEAPRITRKNFINRVAMKPGQTLILSGFERASNDNDKEGPFGSWGWLLGGKKNAVRGKSTTVIMITPHVTRA
jgi:type IVB pilus formation R64 PilN family outer membrane protein